MPLQPSLRSFALGLVSVACLLGTFSTPAQNAGEPKKNAVAKKETEGTKKLWGALIYAVDEENAKRPGFADADAELTTILGKAFEKYRHFQVLGTRSEALFKSTHSWVAPSKELCVKFDSKGLTKDGEGVKLDLQLWNRGEAIVKTDAILEPNSPVFIEGPRWGKGRLLYVLKLQEGGAEADEDETLD